MQGTDDILKMFMFYKLTFILYCIEKPVIRFYLKIHMNIYVLIAERQFPDRFILSKL